MFAQRELKEEGSVLDPSGHYKGIWLRDIPRDPSACYKYYLCVENIENKRRYIMPAKRFFYWGKNQPHFEMRRMYFKDGGLVAEVNKITDVKGNERTIHLNKDIIFKEKIIKIPKNKFPN